MTKITLCGSTKFKREFEAINKQLSLEGHIVYSVAFFGHADNIPLTTEQKALLDQVHKRKIDNSDGILVIDVDGYIGESTTSEIEYAKENKKFVKYLSGFPDLKTICDGLLFTKLSGMKIIISESLVKGVLKEYNNAEISFGKMTEILNEKANDALKS